MRFPYNFLTVSRLGRISMNERSGIPGRDEAGLVAQACRGDRTAMRELWLRHRRWVAVVLLAHKPAWAELDDLLQEVAVAFVRRIGQLREPAAFRSWLRSLAVHTARAAARSGRPLRLVGSAPAQEPASPPIQDPAHATDLRDQTEQVLAAAMALPPEYGEPLLLRCARGMSYRAIAELLDLPVTSVETRIARARRMLRERLAGEAAAAGPARPADRVAEDLSAEHDASAEPVVEP